MNEPITLEVDLCVFTLLKDMRTEQKRFFQLTKDVKKSNLPQLWAERKKCLESCRQLEALADMHIHHILNGVGMSDKDALNALKGQLGMFSPQNRQDAKEVGNG